MINTHIEKIKRVSSKPLIVIKKDIYNSIIKTFYRLMFFETVLRDNIVMEYKLFRTT